MFRLLSLIRVGALMAAPLCLSAAQFARCETGDSAEQLPPATESALRKAIYGRPPAIATDTKEFPPPRSVEVPQELASAFKRQPVAVWALLQRIVEGGRPQDSITAESYAYALAVDPYGAVMIAYLPATAEYETVGNGSLRTRRERAVEFMKNNNPADKPQAIKQTFWQAIDGTFWNPSLKQIMSPVPSQSPETPPTATEKPCLPISAPPHAAAAEPGPSAKSEPVLSDRGKLEKRLGELLCGATLAGNCTGVAGDSNNAFPEVRLTIFQVLKQNDDLWLFEAGWHVEKQDIQTKMPILARVLWAGDTPVIMLDQVAIPHLGTFSARVLFHGDQYAGVWSDGPRNGQIFGRVVRENTRTKGSDYKQNGEK